MGRGVLGVVYPAASAVMWLVFWWAGCLAVGVVHAKEDPLPFVGLARVDITPAYPVRLSGYAARKTESEGVAQPLWAKALAIGSDQEGPAVLITVDNCGVPGRLRDEVVARLARKHHLASDRIAICSSHTHSAPHLKGYLPNLFFDPLPPAEVAHLESYTAELVDALERVAGEALAQRQPARLSHGLGQAGFAANRRTKGGPVDHDLPVLVVSAVDGTVRGIFTSYACHGTTLTGQFNQVCGDWPGYAQEALEAAHPGAIALVALGCAGDANPEPRSAFELARKHGREVAGVVDGLLTNSTLRPVSGKLACRQINLPFDTLPTRAEWESRAAQTNYPGLHARRNLARLDRGDKLPTRLAYTVQVWTFGRELAMIFLPGEAVVDYSLRLKRELDAAHIWINAYANDVPCYIPSERILTEGGYEGAGAMIYYDQPTRFAPGIEDRIIHAVHALTPAVFRAKSPKP